MQAAPAATVADAVLANPARRATLASAFCAAFDFERAAAPLLLHAGASDAGPRSLISAGADADDEADYGASDGASGSAPAAAGAVAGGTAAQVPAPEDGSTAAAEWMTAAAAAAAAPGRAEDVAGQAAAAALPRMPMGLAFVGSRRAYTALATAMRLIGRLAVSAGPGDFLTSLSGNQAFPE